MVFVIGGYSQGKRQYVMENFKLMDSQMCSGEADASEILEAECIYDFHMLVKKWTKEKLNYIEEIEKILEKGKCRYIISDEIGYGIVPLDPFEREYRENVGRASCIIAKQADQVIRITCGIGQRIK